MCRNIKLLFHFDPPTTPQEVQAAALQYVRKVSGTQKPSQANQAAFDQAVAEITRVTHNLLQGMTHPGPPHTREGELAKARLRNLKRFGPPRGAISGRVLP